MMWNLSLNLLFSQFTPLITCSIINFQDIRINSEQNAAKVSAWIAICVLVILLIVLFLIFIKIRNLVMQK
jgi:hypothetical protein